MTRLPGVPDETIIDVIPPGALADLGIVQAVPVLQMNWHDERTGCQIAHRYDAGELQGTPEEYGNCWAYSNGRCKMNGAQDGQPRSACLFHEPEDGPSWAALRQWVLLELEDGSTALTTHYSALEIAADLGARIVGAVPVRR